MDQEEKISKELSQNALSTPSGPLQFLQQAFIAKKAKNSNYSLRAFARDLGMSQTLLSLIMNRKRSLTLKQVQKLVSHLKLNTTQAGELLNSTLAALPENAKLSPKLKLKKKRNDFSGTPTSMHMEEFHFISQWYHLAIMNLSTTEGFDSKPQAIAKRLGISSIEAKTAIERMISLGLMDEVDGVIKKRTLHQEWKPAQSVAAIRNFHQQMIEKAQSTLLQTDQASYETRSITGTCLALDSSKIEEAKIYIKKFEREFVRRFTVGAPDEVYQLNLQLFPLSLKNPKTKIGKL